MRDKSSMVAMDKFYTVQLNYMLTVCPNTTKAYRELLELCNGHGSPLAEGLHCILVLTESSIAFREEDIQRLPSRL